MPMCVLGAKTEFCIVIPYSLPYPQRRGAQGTLPGIQPKGKGMMKRLLYLAMLAMLAMLVLAPAAGAQDFPVVADPSQCPGNTVPTGGGGEFICFPAEFACEGIVSQADFEACVAEQQAMQAILAPEPAAPVPAPAPAPTAPAMTPLPDTGGLALLLPVAALLMGSGLLGFAALRRRS